MAEFSLQCDEVTHGQLADGAIHTTAVRKGKVAIGRSGAISYYHISLGDSAVYHFRVLAQPRPEVRLICLVEGQNVCAACAGHTKGFSAGESNCFFISAGCAQEITMDGAGQSELFILAIGLPDIPVLISGNHPYLYNFLKSGKCAWLLEKYNLPLSMEQMTVIQRVLHEKKPVYLRPAYVQLKLAELYVLFLEQAVGFDEKSEIAGLRPDELERIRRVRTMLHDHPAESYSLVGLAHTVGTNEATLKKNFKAVFGTTVFGYLTACRMERAKALLLDNKLKVSAVAQEVGYKYASHFSAAFRKYFGYLPTKIVRMVISIPSVILADELESLNSLTFALLY